MATVYEVSREIDSLRDVNPISRVPSETTSSRFAEYSNDLYAVINYERGTKNV